MSPLLTPELATTTPGNEPRNHRWRCPRRRMNPGREVDRPTRITGSLCKAVTSRLNEREFWPAQPEDAGQDGHVDIRRGTPRGEGDGLVGLANKIRPGLSGAVHRAISKRQLGQAIERIIRVGRSVELKLHDLLGIRDLQGRRRGDRHDLGEQLAVFQELENQVPAVYSTARSDCACLDGRPTRAVQKLLILPSSDSRGRRREKCRSAASLPQLAEFAPVHEPITGNQ